MTLYSQRHTIPSDAKDQVIAGFTRETLVPEMQAVDVIVETDGGQADRINFKVDSCHGDILIELDESGDVRLFYSVC